eukprot:jgi/Tetstr1/449375/TSEL_003885.t1
MLSLASATQLTAGGSRPKLVRAELAYVIHRKLRAPSALGVTRWTVPMLYFSFHQTFAEDSRWKHFPTRQIRATPRYILDCDVTVLQSLMAKIFADAAMLPDPSRSSTENYLPRS